IVALSEGARGRAHEATAASVVPYRMLDGYGHLVRPGADAAPLKGADIDSVVPSAEHPPALYGNEGAYLSLNAVAETTTLHPLADLGRPVANYSRASAVALEWPLLTIALLLLLVDAVISLWLRGHIDVRQLRKAAVATPVLLLLVVAPHHVRADDTKNMAAA